MQNCPSCQAPLSEELKECPRCGVLFAKWQERQENVEQGNLSRYQQIATATSSEFNWIILVLVCLTILGVFYFLGQQPID